MKGSSGISNLHSTAESTLDLTEFHEDKKLGSFETTTFDPQDPI